MVVLGPKLYRLQLDLYLSQLMAVQLGTFAILLLGGAVIALVTMEPALSAHAIALAAAFCLYHLYWFVRRAFYLKLLPHLALPVTCVYVATSLGAVWLTHFSGALSVSVVFAAMAVAGTVAASSGWWLLGIGDRRLSTAWGGLGAVAAQHWRYGRWVLGSTLLQIGAGAAYPPLIAIMVDVEAAGYFRGMDMLFAPVTQLTAAISMLVLPAIAADDYAGNPPRMRKIAHLIVAGFGAMAALYILPVVIFGPEIASFVYARQDFASASWLLPYLGMAAFVVVVVNAYYVLLRATKLPNVEFWSHLAGTICTFTAGLLFAAAFGLWGIALSLVLARMAALCVALFGWSASNALRQPSPSLSR
jgi:O-antigen/teichoic acid export membrane protein